MPNRWIRAGRETAFRVRVKDGASFKSSRLLSRSHRNAASRVNSGRIISVTKISPEEVGRFGDFFRIGRDLMREFRTGRREENVNTQANRNPQRK